MHETYGGSKEMQYPGVQDNALQNGPDSVLFNPGCQKQFGMFSFRAGFDITKNDTHFGPPH